MLSGTIEPFEHEGRVFFTSHKRDLGGRVLAEWFDNDLVSKAELAKIVGAINAASKLSAGGWVWGGNAHNVFVSGEVIYIENEHVDTDRVFITKAQLLTALEKFREFFVNERRDKHFTPIVIEVDFEAEGDLAEKEYLKLIGV